MTHVIMYTYLNFSKRSLFRTVQFLLYITTVHIFPVYVGIECISV